MKDVEIYYNKLAVIMRESELELGPLPAMAGLLSLKDAQEHVN